MNKYQHKFIKINTESKAPLQAVLPLMGIFRGEKSVYGNNFGTLKKHSVLC